MNFKKISAAISAIVMGATMAAGMAMNASAQETVTTTTTGCFYAFYDHDNDSSTPDQWAPAPYGMDAGNIEAITANADGTYTLTLQDATYSIPAIGNKTGWIDVLTDPDGNNILTGSNSYGHPAYANGIVATDVSNWSTSDFQNASNEDCVLYDMTAKVTLIGSISIQHQQKDVIFVVS